MTDVRRYSELIKFAKFEDRFRYLSLKGKVAEETFGFDRYLNQVLYSSKEWKDFRKQVIIRDNGCDLAHPDRPLFSYILIHHLNPITLEDIEKRRPCIFDLENVVCTSRITHNAIHYGDQKILVPSNVAERKPNDTCPWR